LPKPLSREHDRTAFRSGIDALDGYRRELALQDIKPRFWLLRGLNDA